VKLQSVGLILAGLVAGLILAWAIPNAQPMLNSINGTWCLVPSCYCHGPKFEVAVHQGPDAGFEVEGTITYGVRADGTFDVVIDADDGTKVRGKGQAVGRGLDMVFVMDNGDHLYAHGTLDTGDLRQCVGGAAGPLTGPRYGDIGDWGSNYPPYIRTISGDRLLNGAWPWRAAGPLTVPLALRGAAADTPASAAPAAAAPHPAAPAGLVAWLDPRRGR
jgi:hypothetical protein